MDIDTNFLMIMYVVPIHNIMSAVIIFRPKMSASGFFATCLIYFLKANEFAILVHIANVKQIFSGLFFQWNTRAQSSMNDDSIVYRNVIWHLCDVIDIFIR